MVNTQLLKILLNSPLPPQVTELRSKDCLRGTLIIDRIERYVGPKSKWPQIFSHLDNWDYALQAIGLTITFLEKMMLAEQTIQKFSYNEYSLKSFEKLLEMDSQAFQNLEILEVRGSNSTKNEGSLLHFLDNTNTAFGKREFKKWVCNPLGSAEKINNRLDTVEELVTNQNALSTLRAELKKIPDIDKYTAKLYKYGSNNSLTSKAIYFEDVHAKKFKELQGLLEMLSNLDRMHTVFESLKLKSKLINDLMSYDKEFPDPLSIVEAFKDVIKWGRNEQDEEIIIIPSGADSGYDSIMDSMECIKKELQDILVREQENFRCPSIKYVHSKCRYELEVPEGLAKGDKKPNNYEFTSKRQGYTRYHTPRIKELVDKLDACEEKAKVAIAPFISSVFEKLYNFKPAISQLIKCVAHVDCLCSLAINSSYEGFTRPTFCKEPMIELRGIKHPCLMLTNTQFIPNDIVINTKENQNKSVLVVSGPNMGGKSTILRQACIAVTMAQIGCFLPATKAVLPIVDRIFTRIGASDRILEGHSTFYVELEEAKNIVDFATPNSLAIIDELGRGTSTYDGAAIAEAVLKHICENNKCLTLFSTHYRSLIDRCKKLDNVEFYHMGCKETEQEVIFSYKFTQGICPSSYGMNVARLAGIPKSIIEKAKMYSAQMDKKINHK
jgi:DNA mismatch repair protein MSH6